MISISPSERWSATLVGLEGVGLVFLAGWQVVAMMGGDTEALPTAIALVVLTVIGAVALLAFAGAILRGQSWGRSGGVVTQLLILAIAGGAVTGASAHPLLGAAIAAPAVVTLVLLIVASRNAARRETDAAG